MTTKESAASRISGPSGIEQLKERKEPSLGELNPLLFPPDLENPEAVGALKLVIKNNLIKLGLSQPKVLESALAFSTDFRKLEPRFVVRFETDSLSSAQLDLLEQITHITYGKAIAGRTNLSNQSVPPAFYPNLEMPKERKTKVNEDRKKLGWYMGPELSPLTGTHTGLFVHRDFGDVGMAAYLKNHPYKEWFFKDNLINPMSKEVKTKYLVEIREALMYQTDIAEFAIQVASILATGNPVENPRLKYDIYNDLNRLGLKKTQKEDIQGLDEQLSRIERVLFLPLANLQASIGIDFKPGSVLLIGVPGTGKTLAVEYFLQQDIGVFLLPIDALHLVSELSQPPEKRKILPRISEVAKQTQIPVVLHIDDIENIASTEQMINSTLLNLMAGVRESGFFLIASTNHPEKINPSLLQPQRFSDVIYFGLQSESVRLRILETHAQKVSKELDKPLFTSDRDREIILMAIAKVTDSFTPRFLAQVCTEAKSFYLQRMSQARKTKTGLTEEDIDDTFTLEDWKKALTEVNRKYDKEGVVRRDKELREFAEHFYQTIGFNTNHKGITPSLEATIAQIRNQKM